METHYGGRTGTEWASIFQEAAVSGGWAIQDYLDRNATLEVTAKAPGDFVTGADLASSAAIRKVLLRKTGGIDILDEENKASHELVGKSSIFVSVDPLDGTKHFHATGGAGQQWGIGLALIVEGRVVVALIYRPQALDMKTAYAIRGAGTFYFTGSSWALAEHVPIRIDDGRPIPSSLVMAVPTSHAMTSESMRDYFLPLVQSKVLGVSGGFFCAVGNCFGLLRRDMHAYVNITGGTIYDLAPLDLIVREAGGVARTIDDREIVWTEMVQPCLFARNRVVADMIFDTWKNAREPQFPEPATTG